VFPFQITDVEMEVPRLVDDVSVLVFRRADVDERTVPVLQGEPLELAIFFDIKQSDCFYSPVVRVASYIDPFMSRVQPPTMLVERSSIGARTVSPPVSISWTLTPVYW